MNYKTLPKIELHLHLDCSLSFEVVKKIDPSISHDDYFAAFVAPPKCTDLPDFLTRAVKGVDLMQTKEHLRIVTLDLFRQLKEDYVIYAEIRFAPLQHLKEGLSAEEVVREVLEATEESVNSTGIDAGIILCTLRHFSEEDSMETIKLVRHFKNTRVVGFDIAGDEAGYPIDNHIKAFKYARRHGIRCTAHAGEARGPESVKETLKYFHPERIGHGVRSIEDSELQKLLKKLDIHLEICPTSNVQTNVITSIDKHPVNDIYESGLSMSVNTDTRTISNVTLTDEYETLARMFNWGKKHFCRCNLEAVDHIFSSEKIKARLRQEIKKAYCL